MSTRRSPRLKGLSPKPELPPKPRPPKRVKDVLANSVREANFQVELAAWEAAKEEHDNLMKKRKTKQKAAGRAAGKSAAEAEAPPPAAPPAALAPPPQLSADEALLVGSPALAERREFEILTPAEERFPRLRRSLARWALDVEAVAMRCGAGRAQILNYDGMWFDFEEYGGVSLALVPQPAPVNLARSRACARCRAGVDAFYEDYDFTEQGGYPAITAEQRALQFKRLEGLGEEPTLEELGAMRWPHRCWWEDRDRIGECQSF